MPPSEVISTTRKNLMILNRLRKEINSENNRFLFLVKAPHITRINLSILRICLTERNERGIYISVDKPDKHVKQILERHNISKEGRYMDTGVESRTPQDMSGMDTPKKILVVSGIFCPTLFLDSIETTMEQSEQSANKLISELGDMHFIMVDNLSTMTVYNSLHKITEFFTRFDAFLKKFPNLRVFLSSDRNLNREIYTLAKRFSENEIDIDDEWL